MSTNPKRDVFANLARVGTALSSPTRIEFLELLAQAERSVEQLATLTARRSPIPRSIFKSCARRG